MLLDIATKSLCYSIRVFFCYFDTTILLYRYVAKLLKYYIHLITYSYTTILSYYFYETIILPYHHTMMLLPYNLTDKTFLRVMRILCEGGGQWLNSLDSLDSTDSLASLVSLDSLM